MGIREDLARRIEKKQTELALAEREWEKQKAGVEAYILALQETIRSLPREASDVRPEDILRPGGVLARVRGLVLAKRTPQDVHDILQALGKPNDKKSRASITSMLGTYVRRGEIFVRTSPNTFGLIELGHNQFAPERDEEPPPDFGKVQPGRSDTGNNVEIEDDDSVAF